MGRLGNINNYVSAQSDAKKQEVNMQYDQQQQTQQQPVQQQPPQAPISQPSIAAATNSNPMAGAEQVNFREKTLQNLDENDFKARQKELNASDKEYWSAKLKQNPESSYSILREYFASDETPEEKAKRERRDALGETFRNLGNVIGNAANLYYAHRGGTPVDLNTANEKHNERIRQLKEKQDAIQRQREQMFLNAKINDIKSERAKADKKEEREYNAQQQAERYRREDAIRAQNQKNLDRDYEFRVKQDERNAQKQEEERAYKRRQDELNNNFRWAQLNWQKEKNNSTNSGTKNSKLAVVDTPKGTMNVDFGRINERTYEQLYQKANKEFSEMSEDERKKFNLPVIGISDSKEDRQKKMGEIVSAAILNIPGYSDWFETAGVGAYQQQKTDKPTVSKQDENKPIDWSAYLKNQKNNDSEDVDYTSHKRVKNSSDQPMKDSNQSVVVESAPVNSPVTKMNKYDLMVEKINDKKAREAEEQAQMIADSIANQDKKINDAKAKRIELTRKLNEDYPEMDIEKFLKDNGIDNPLEAASIRRQYADDEKERAKIKREIERLNLIINNR